MEALCQQAKLDHNSQEVHIPTFQLEIQKLLHDYDDVFDDIHELPPEQNCDHKIPLKDGNNPINVRSYR